ncbi:conserved protein, unknown function [Hepatocystis sp. ex Piliocolobus tephrosceles]|nr:conserved protein, unknown function [Hepatocystis sp. ex Piliocolobus tephrosceles]
MWCSLFSCKSKYYYKNLNLPLIQDEKFENVFNSNKKNDLQILFENAINKIIYETKESYDYNSDFEKIEKIENVKKGKKFHSDDDIDDIDIILKKGNCKNMFLNNEKENNRKYNIKIPTSTNKHRIYSMNESYNNNVNKYTKSIAKDHDKNSTKTNVEYDNILNSEIAQKIKNVIHENLNKWFDNFFKNTNMEKNPRQVINDEQKYIHILSNKIENFSTDISKEILNNNNNNLDALFQYNDNIAHSPNVPKNYNNNSQDFINNCQNNQHENSKKLKNSVFISQLNTSNNVNNSEKLIKKIKIPIYQQTPNDSIDIHNNSYQRDTSTGAPRKRTYKKYVSKAKNKAFKNDPKDVNSKIILNENTNEVFTFDHFQKNSNNNILKKFHF